MVRLHELSCWLDEQTNSDRIWYVKRLSANDTLASGGHQAGPYIPKKFILDIFPSLQYNGKNPRVSFELRIDSHHNILEPIVIWYNNKYYDGGTRDEMRITNLGGQKSVLLDPDSTGSLVVFSFYKRQGKDTTVCNVWVCDHATQEDMIEDRIGVVEPSKFLIRAWDNVTLQQTSKGDVSCWLSPQDMPEDWKYNFPTTKDIIQKVIQLRPDIGDMVDARLIRRRNCEFELFRSVEENIEFPFIKNGFENIDSFLMRAQTILQRRKARSGRSLELHLREIFLEEKLNEGMKFSYQPESDIGKKPDFLFPCEAAYKYQNFPAGNLRMLAVKTTCKDRWRQIINEADRIQTKHLFTLQEGVSQNQFNEMVQANIKLVVPQVLINKYPLEIRGHLQTLESFIADIRILPMFVGVHHFYGSL